MTGRLPHGSRLLAALLATVLALALALAGCGDDAREDAGAGGPSPATVAPADAAFYGEVVIRPDGELRDDVLAAARKVLRVDDPGAELRRLLDDAAADEDLSFGEDVEPWLGDRLGLFVQVPERRGTQPEVGFAVAVRDRGRLDALLERERDRGQVRSDGSYKGVEYERVDDELLIGVVGDFVVAAQTLRTFRDAVDAAGGASLADAQRYDDAVDDVDDDAIAFLYVDPDAIVTQLRAIPGADPDAYEALDRLPLAGADPVVASLTADADEIVLEATADAALADAYLARDDEGAGEVTVGQLPGDAWLALATPPLGPIVEQVLDGAGVRAQARRQVRERFGLDLDRDLLDALGGLGLFARGGSVLDVGGGLLLQLDSAASAQRLLTRVQALVGAGLGTPARSVELSGARGFELQIPQSPQPIVVLAKGDRIAAGYAASSALDLLDPQQRFDESSAGKAAIATLGEDFTPSFVLIAEPLVGLLRALDQLQVADLSDVLPYLQAYESIAVGTERDDDETTVRAVVALR